MKWLLDKTVENQKMIETRRKNVNFGVSESRKIHVWEAQVTNDSTPLLAAYKNWKKSSDLQQAKKASEQEQLDDYSHIPALKKNNKKIRMKQEAAAEVGASCPAQMKEVEVSHKIVPIVQPAKIPSDGDSSGEDYDDNDGNDEVEDLKLEELDSDSGADLQDEFDASNDGGDK